MYPQNTILTDLVNQLNNVGPTINFAFRAVTNHSLTFLDIISHRNNSRLSFDVYRKSTNKNDLVHFYSIHSYQIKSGIIIDFYLRTLRICSCQYLPKGETDIENTFKNCQYPYHFIHNAKGKIQKINNYNQRIALSTIIS